MLSRGRHHRCWGEDHNSSRHLFSSIACQSVSRFFTASCCQAVNKNLQSPSRTLWLPMKGIAQVRTCLHAMKCRATISWPGKCHDLDNKALEAMLLELPDAVPKVNWLCMHVAIVASLYYVNRDSKNMGVSAWKLDLGAQEWSLQKSALQEGSHWLPVAEWQQTGWASGTVLTCQMVGKGLVPSVWYSQLWACSWSMTTNSLLSNI